MFGQVVANRQLAQTDLDLFDGPVRFVHNLLQLVDPLAMLDQLPFEQPVLTARSNDFGYGSVFERPIELWAEPGDLWMSVSSSGKSKNIVRALHMARTKQCKLITFSGFSPENPSRLLGDLNFYVPSSVYAYVETAHMALIHFLTAGPALNANKPGTP